MLGGDEGQFRFTNGTAIDVFLNKNRILDVINHEFTHSLLYSTTSYGQFVMMLDKNGIVDGRSNIIKNALFTYMGRMQERVAVNIELMIRCASRGISDYIDAIDSLKMRNNVYYNHFRKLCCLNGKIREQNDAIQLIRILREIARVALNVDLNQIPVGEFRTEKDVISFFTNPINNARYSPNKRFEILVNVFFRENDNNNDIHSVYEGSLNLNKMYDAQYIHDVAMDAIKEMYAFHHLKERLVTRVESVGAKQIIFFEGADLLAAKPARINEDKKHFIKQIKTLEEFIKILEQQERKYVYIYNRIRGFEEFQVIGVYEEKKNKRITYSYMFFEEDNKKIFEILKSFECHFVFYKTKFLSKESNAVRKMVRQLPVYIYEDTPLLASFDVIGQMFYGGKYSYIRRINDTILVFQKRSICLFTNIFTESEEILNRELGKFNIEYIDIDDERQISEIMYLDKMCNDYEGNSIEDAKMIGQ